MKWSVIVFLGLCGFVAKDQARGVSSTDPSISSTQDTHICALENFAYQGGEVINYKLYYNWGFIWIPAGEVTFSVRETNQDYKISALGTTYDSYSWLFSLSDTFTTVIDKKTLLPKTFTRKIHEGKYDLYEKIIFDHASRSVSVERGKSRKKTISSQHDITRCAQDVLSSIYFLRNTSKASLIEKKNIAFKMFLDSKMYDLNMSYRGKAKTKIESRGKVHTLLIRPQLLSGTVFKDEDKMKVWVSDDKNHLPILVESPIAVGSIKALIQNYSGLRHPLNWVND